jgi:hypothetical protein
MISVSVNPFTHSIDDGFVESVAETPVGPMYRDCNLKYEANVIDGEVRVSQKTQTVHSSDLGLSQGILGTAKNNGFTVQDRSEVTADTLVTVNGMEMTVRSAANLGFMVKLPDGSYSDAKEGDTGAIVSPSPQQDQEDIDPYNPDLSSQQIESVLEEAAGDLGGYEALERQALSAISGLVKEDLAGAITGLASAAGATPEEAEGFINGLYDSFRTKSAEYISRKHGVDAEEVFEWATHALHPHEKSSLYYRVYLGRSSALDSLVERFQRSGRKGA